MTPELVRKRNLARLKKAGFSVAPSLPLDRGPRALRSARELACRLMALDAVTCWVIETNASVADERVTGYARLGKLGKWMTRSDKLIFAAPRAEAHARYVDTIGWRLENMWALAWALGYDEEPDADGEQIGRSTGRAILTQFLPGLSKTPDDLLARCEPRHADAVRALEDLFYCAHNAVRSAQLGGKTVPGGFDPVSMGGVIHERRHALSWCLSDEDWDDVDLST